MSRLSGAGLFLNTRPDRSYVEPWHGQRKPPGQSSGRLGWAPSWKRGVGVQPRCVQTATATSRFLCSARERYSLLQYSGSGMLNAFFDCGSASSGSAFLTSASISSVRFRIQTGLPRQATVIRSPGLRPDISTSTGAPAALAFSDGANDPTNGTQAATPPIPPITVVVISQVRRLPSTR